MRRHKVHKGRPITEAAPKDKTKRLLNYKDECESDVDIYMHKPHNMHEKAFKRADALSSGREGRPEEIGLTSRLEGTANHNHAMES